MKKKEILKLYVLTNHPNFSSIDIDEEYWFPTIPDLDNEINTLKQEIKEALKQNANVISTLKELTTSCPPFAYKLILFYVVPQLASSVTNIYMAITLPTVTLFIMILIAIKIVLCLLLIITMKITKIILKVTLKKKSTKSS